MFSTVYYIHTVKDFSIVNFSGILLLFYDPVKVGNLTSGSSAFSKCSLYIWKFLVGITLKPSMQDFKHDPTSMGDACNCAVVSTYLSTTLLGSWEEAGPFPVLWPLLSFPTQIG